MKPKDQTIADPFDIFLSSPVVANGAVYFGRGTETFTRSIRPRAICAGNSKPAMLCTLARARRRRFVFGVGTVISTLWTLRQEKKMRFHGGETR